MAVEKYDVIIIGAGPGGLLAAGSAASAGARALLLERGERVGRKLRICGKGRANITNIAPVPEFVKAFGRNGKFLFGPFSRWFRDDLIDLLDSLGVPSKVERGGRMFPLSDDADDVADALERWARQMGAAVRFDSRVTEITASAGKVTGVKLNNDRIRAGAVILCTGGITYPSTGSTGDGYKLASALGHTIVPPKPALAAMKTADTWIRDAQGLSLKNVQGSLHRAGPEDLATRRNLVAREFGEMLITHFGVSGPIILTLSKLAVELIGKEPLALVLNLKPALSDEQLQARFDREMTISKHLRNYLKELLPRSLVDPFIGYAGLAGDCPLNRLTHAERKRLAEKLHSVRLQITGLRPAEEAIVTAGGVEIGEIDSRTMQSRIVSGLYFAGEVMDIEATTGGYNLQAAFSTGWVAGQSAAAATSAASGTASA